MPWPFPTSTPAAAGHGFARLDRVSEPSDEPVTSAEAKLWLKLDDSADDTIVEELIKAARSIFEELTGRTLISTDYVAYFDGLPRAGTYVGAPTLRTLELPRAPLIEVTAITYLDADGAEQTFADTSWDPDEAGGDAAHFPRVHLTPSADWPALGSLPGALRVAFTAGYGTTAADVPAEIKVCLKLLVTHLYQNRAPVNVGNIVNELPWSLQHLIQMHTIRSIV